jgi:hypothetical protein
MSAKPGSVTLLGGFNCRVGTSLGHTAWDNSRAPAGGESTCNAPGKLLLQLAEKHSLHFLSAQRPDARYTCFGNEQSMVGHILLSCEQVEDRHLATTLSRTQPDVAACRSDHAPVMAPRLPTGAGVRPRRQRSRRWRLEKLVEPTAARAYVAGVEAAAPDWHAAADAGVLAGCTV